MEVAQFRQGVEDVATLVLDGSLREKPDHFHRVVVGLPEVVPLEDRCGAVARNPLTEGVDSALVV